MQGEFGAGGAALVLGLPVAVRGGDLLRAVQEGGGLGRLAEVRADARERREGVREAPGVVGLGARHGLFGERAGGFGFAEQEPQFGEVGAFEGGGGRVAGVLGEGERAGAGLQGLVEPSGPPRVLAQCGEHGAEQGRVPVR
ncbi:hypothetical protein GA0115252_115320, partial [Streptomyces sp. DfronAA-171]